jgi:hypothetical protein
LYFYYIKCKRRNDCRSESFQKKIMTVMFSMGWGLL